MNEREKPQTIEDMRQSAHLWVKNRPTFKHTQQSLTRVLSAEIDELQEALKLGRAESALDLEVGDVFFALLALDNDTESEHGQLYTILDGYCDARGISKDKLFERILFKNNGNYPWVFFNEMTPFMDPADAMSCLRIIRRTIHDSMEMDAFWGRLDQELNELPFFDGWVATGKFRGFVKRKLTNISKRVETTPEDKDEIKRLRKVGRWTMEPFDIEGNRLSWRK
jgi:NTP pyrophosphatase (non-canonical NTP hydrolase)